jgi:hypothetical protein
MKERIEWGRNGSVPLFSLSQCLSIFGLNGQTIVMIQVEIFSQCKKQSFPLPDGHGLLMNSECKNK